MALHWRPVGPLPAATYWRRRGVVALVAVAVLVAAVLLIGGGSGDDTLTAAPDDRADATATPTPSASTTAPEQVDVDTCADDVLEVQARSDAADYAVGARATLTLTVRNTGGEPCRRALGQGAVELVISSGEDRIWSSDDCAPGGGAGEVVLQPGASQTARASWPGTRSAAGCPDDQPQARPGTYRVTGRVGELQVPGMVFRVQEG